MRPTIGYVYVSFDSGRAIVFLTLYFECMASVCVQIEKMEHRNEANALRIKYLFLWSSFSQVVENIANQINLPVGRVLFERATNIVEKRGSCSGICLLFMLMSLLVFA